MHWSSLPLIEMDDYDRKGAGKPEENRKSRSQERYGGDHLENDIGRQLSELREQTRISKDDDKPLVDAFGRDISKRKHVSDSEGEERKNTEDREQERYGRTEEDRDWRRGRDDDMVGDYGRDRGRDRNRDWGRDEQRRRPRGDWDRGDYYSDEAEDNYGGRLGDRERYRDRRRDREYDGFRDRRDRDRDYRERDDRDWRRDDYRRRDYRGRRRNEEEGHWSDYRSRDGYRDERDYHRREYWYEEPSEVVILKGLPSSVEDDQIHDLLAAANLPYKDVRVVKNREGFSRGFAFVEFLDVDTAKSWIELCKGKVEVDNSSVIMDFSRSKAVMETHRDWICGKCGTQNFSSKRRNTCFCCSAPKDEHDEHKDIGQTPCKVLILRGLDTLTTEETIRHCLSSFTSLPIFDVRLIKDKMTNTSRGFCFIELGSIEEATKLMEEMQNASFMIDDRAVTVSFARFGAQPPKPSGPSHSGSGSSITTSGASGTLNEPTAAVSASSANQSMPKNNFAANAIAQAHAAAKMGHTTDPTPPQMHGTVGECAEEAVPSAEFPQDPSVNPGVPSEPGPIMPPPAAQEQSTVAAMPSAPGAPQPVSSYVYDAATGFYYDTATGLYYDPNTQYYYNSTTQQYMYWDAATQQYVAVVSTNAQAPAAAGNPNPGVVPNEADNQALSKEKQKKAKTLNAKKIAKDMERWAKKVNVNKETQCARAQAPQGTPEASKESTYQYDPNELKKTSVKMSFSGTSNISSLSLTSSSPLAALSDLDDSSAQAAPPKAAASLVAEYGGDDSAGEEESKEDNFTDWTKMACLLCKRQFPSKEALQRHNTLSDLHKQNLQIQKKLKMSFSEIDEYERQQREAKYRDRAKERRELFGQPDSAPSSGKRKRKGGKVAYEQPTKDGITSDNIGNKMLKAMGWTQGTGLGKDRQGIVDPILAKMRNRSAGLGLHGSDYGATAGDSERDLLKKMAQSRYDSVE